MIFGLLFILVVAGLVAGSAGGAGVVLGLFMLAVFVSLCALAWPRRNRGR